MRKPSAKSRNWVLVVVAVVIALVGAGLTYIAVTNIPALGWTSLLIGIGGLSLMAASITAIAKNDPSWILMSLVIPG